jgi:hypothetical protein
MKTDGTDGKTPQPFPFRIDKNGSGNGIYRLWKREGNEKFTGIHYC